MSWRLRLTCESRDARLDDILEGRVVLSNWTCWWCAREIDIIEAGVRVGLRWISVIHRGLHCSATIAPYTATELKILLFKLAHFGHQLISLLILKLLHTCVFDGVEICLPAALFSFTEARILVAEPCDACSKFGSFALDFGVFLQTCLVAGVIVAV